MNLIIITAAPLILLGTSALITEYTGTLAVFIDGIINLGAFLCITLSILTGSTLLGTLLSITICAIFIFLCCLFTIHFNANPFLTGLGINFLTTGIISYFSQQFFNTTSVISEPAKDIFTSNTLMISKVPLSLFAWIISITILFLLQKTTWGRHIRITGSNPELLEARGLNITTYKLTTWTIAAIFSAFAGCLYAFRLSAFVPNISSGRGWIALAAIFIGRKKGWGTVIVLVIFAIVDYGTTAIQGTNILHISPTLLLSIPYLVALLLFIFQPKNNTLS
ncbi:MAG: hypothetical protein BKP49_04020 [Treponema sp. CETP13]|nr:MAG: hypothetical protein BKP49_04020 [Treponema sp. CETP13]